MSEETPNDLHRRSIVFDAHCDVLDRVLAGRRLAVRGQDGHVDLPRLRAGGVTTQVFAICQYCDTGANVKRPPDYARRALEAFFIELEANRDSLTLATAVADILQAKEQGLVAVVLALEGAEALGGELPALHAFHRQGVRMVSLTWNHCNAAGDGVDVPDAGGLTEFGRELVAEMNRLGVIVDVAHLASAGVRDVLEISRCPVVASHANAHALCPNRRNLTDEQLRAISDRGGVVGVTFVPQFIVPRGQATLARLLDHVDHMVRVAGIDHVGLGSDFEGFAIGPDNVPELADVSCLPHLTGGLLRRGYSVDEVKKILGGNFLRLFKEVTERGDGSWT